jgi:hypothetical protein
MTKFWVKSSISLGVLTKKKFLYLFKNKIIYNFMIFVATKHGRTTKFFPPPHLVLLLDPGSDIRDKHPGSATLPPSTEKGGIKNKDHDDKNEFVLFS